MAVEKSAGESAQAAGEDRQLIADLFHALNQPITALRCALELSLLQLRSAEQYRATLQSGLQQAEQIAGWATGIRELLQADDAGDDLQILRLEGFLREAVADLEPVAESLQVSLALRCHSLAGVRFESRRLRQALFGLLEFALGASRAGSGLQLDARYRKGQTIILLAALSGDADSGDGLARTLPEEPEEEDRGLALRRRLSLAIPRRMVEAAGGSLQVGNGREGLRIEICLPSAPAPEEGQKGN